MKSDRSWLRRAAPLCTLCPVQHPPSCRGRSRTLRAPEQGEMPPRISQRRAPATAADGEQNKPSALPPWELRAGFTFFRHLQLQSPPGSGGRLGRARAATEPVPVCWSLRNPPVCRPRSLGSRGGDCSPLPCCPRTPCRQRQRPAWSGTCSPPCTTACCRRSAENTVAQDVVTATANPSAQISSAGRGSPRAQPPTPREPFGAARARVLSGGTPTYVHVIAEGGVGAVLQPALVAHVVEDTRGDQGVVQHLPGGGVIQAQPPAPAETERSERHHHRPSTPVQRSGSC